MADEPVVVDPAEVPTEDPAQRQYPHMLYHAEFPPVVVQNAAECIAWMADGFTNTPN